MNNDLIKTREFVDYIKNLPKDEYTLVEILTILTSNKFVKRIESRNFIIESVAKEYSLTPKQMFKKCRERKFIECRKLVCYLLTKYTGLSLDNIGNIIGKDHSTVFHSKQWVIENFGNVTEKKFYSTLKKIEDEVKLFINE
jgi:chromosomal replication initiation ATPase DnaA